MASYTNVPDSVLEPGDPIRSVDIIAIKDNIEHYAENNGTTTVFTSPGTWTKPATVKRIKVTVVGGGGNGGIINPSPVPVGAPTLFVTSGGGGGGASIRWIPAPSIPGPVTVTRGAAGGTSSFGAFASATGGSSGVASGGPSAPAPSFNPVAGGLGSSGDLNLRGSTGLNIRTFPGGTVSGGGGGSVFGGSTLGVLSTPTAPDFSIVGNAADSVGVGGSGSHRFGRTTPVAGGAGANGIVIVEEFY
jgi:hypothetical protein